MFDRYLDQSTGGWRRRALVGASLVAHALVGGFLFVTTLFTVDEIRPPAIPLVFLHTPPPPPPPALGVRAPSSTPPTNQRPLPRRPPRLTQPSEAPSSKSEVNKYSEEGEEGDPEGVIGGSKEGVQGGVIGGVEGGLVGSQAPLAPMPAPPPPPPKMVASFIFDRERVSHPDPHLTQEFTHQHPNQTVSGMYRICVDTDGKVMKMETVSSISGMDDLIIQHVKATWQWKPQPHPVCTVRTFKFIIK